VIIETDSLALKDAVTSTSHDLSVGRGLFQEIRNLIAEEFISLNVSKISRVCNVCAHELAHMGLSWDPGQFQVWAAPFPEFVNSLMARDLAEHLSVNARH
jgi:hypothetical protein